MTCNVRHLFICLFAILLSSLIRCLLRSLVHFSIGLFVFLLLSFKSYFYILDNSPLSDVSFANIFSHSVAWLLILLTSSFTEQEFSMLMKSSLSIISFMDCAFGILSFFKKNIYLFIWLCWVLVVARGIFFATYRIFSCSMWDLLVAACRIF